MSDCQMWRRMRIGRGFLGAPESSFVYTFETRRCGTPLFSSDKNETICRSCREGWQCPENMPLHPPLVVPEAA